MFASSFSAGHVVNPSIDVGGHFNWNDVEKIAPFSIAFRMTAQGRLTTTSPAVVHPFCKTSQPADIERGAIVEHRATRVSSEHLMLIG